MKRIDPDYPDGSVAKENPPLSTKCAAGISQEFAENAEKCSKSLCFLRALL
jgi:hypothetical protein